METEGNTFRQSTVLEWNTPPCLGLFYEKRRQECTDLYGVLPFPLCSQNHFSSSIQLWLTRRGRIAFAGERTFVKGRAHVGGFSFF